MSKSFFETNPVKASSKVTINSFMMGSLFMVFTLVWAIGPEELDPLVITQLVLAMPLLFVSSLANAKIGYKQKTGIWEAFAWHTNTFGNALIFNVVGLLVGSRYLSLAVAYFAVTIFIMILYSIVNLMTEPDELYEKLYKFTFHIAILIIFGLIPLLVR